jgi:hypothetical protein
MAAPWRSGRSRRTPRSQNYHNERESTEYGQQTSTAPAHNGRQSSIDRPYDDYNHNSPSFGGPESVRLQKRKGHESHDVDNSRPVKKGKATGAENRRWDDGNYSQGTGHSPMLPPSRPDVNTNFASAQYPRGQEQHHDRRRNSADDLFPHREHSHSVQKQDHGQHLNLANDFFTPPEQPRPVEDDRGRVADVLKTLKPFDDPHSLST